MNLPYEDIVILILQLFMGTGAFILSFIKKHSDGLVKNHSPKFAKRFQTISRYGGILIILIAIFSYTNSKYITVSNPQENEIISKFGDENKVELLQKNAGKKQKSGWFKGTGGNGKYSIMFPKPYKEFRIPTKNNDCYAYYSASTIYNEIEYLAEYIECKSLNPENSINLILSQNNPDIISIEQVEFEGYPMLNIRAKSPTGEIYNKSIYAKNGQFSLTVRPKTKTNITPQVARDFFNTFKMNI